LHFENQGASGRLLYIEIDAAEHWKINIAKELKASGYEIDVNKII